jgi:hypothetical protein
LAKDVALKIGVTPQTVSQWVNYDEVFRYALWILRKEVLDAARTQLQLSAVEAVTVVRSLLHQGESEQTRLKAAQLLLDRLGLVGRYSEKGFEGAVITTAGGYTPDPEGPSVQAQARMQRIKIMLEKLKQRQVMQTNGSGVASDLTK